MPEESRAVIIIFGGSGDLASRKLYPALFNLYRRGVLAEHFAVIGTARRPWTDDHYHEVVENAVAGDDVDRDQAKAFAQHFFYQSQDVTDADHYITLRPSLVTFVKTLIKTAVPIELATCRKVLFTAVP